MVKNTIKVFARVRKGYDNNTQVKYHISQRNDHEDIIFPPNNTADVKNHKYRFTKVFEQYSNQSEIFNNLAKPIINSVINGFNGTIFAYGQTGSGKTFSITGSQDNYNDRGILPRSIERIFEITKTNSNLYNISVSYLEIYNEVGYDLLSAKTQPSRLEELPRVVLLEDANGEAHLRNLSVLPVTTEQEAMRLLFLGDTNRTIAETPMNEVSSRSHCIFTIYLTNRSERGSNVLRSKLHLVDLAGSERIGRANITGVTLREARHINLSLHYLEQVILALSQSKRTHIPYRNSMMTYILKDSLSGNSLTTMLATLNLNMKNVSESLSTCRFAQRVACISTEAIINEESDPQKEIEFLRGEVDELRRQIAQLKGVNKEHELTIEDQDKCRQIVSNYIESNIMQLCDDLDSHELKYCMQLLKEHMTSKSNQALNLKIEEEIKNKLSSNYKEIIKQKDDEISVLTELLESTPQKLEDKDRVHSAPAQPTTYQCNELKTHLPLTQHKQFDAFIINNSEFEKVTHLRNSLNKKYEIAKTITNTVQKCQINISDIRRKLTDKVATEMSSKLHNFLVSQQKVYRESLEQLENLKNETEFLKECLIQSEKKVLRQFQMTNDESDDGSSTYQENTYYQKAYTDFIPPPVDYKDYSRRTKTAGDYCRDKKTFPTKPDPANLRDFEYRKRDEKHSFKRFSTDLNNSYFNQNCNGVSKDCCSSSYEKSIQEEYSTPSGAGPESTSSSLSTFEEYSISIRSESPRLSSGQSSGKPELTPAGDFDHMASLIKPGDSPAFIEFMKTIPLTDDPEVDDEIFKFYRSKFEQ